MAGIAIDSEILDLHSCIMETARVTHDRLAARLKALRQQRALSLDALADRSGVSRSMISLIERGESSPTAVVLDRLAAGLGVTLASLFADETNADATPLARRDDQRTWRDPATGYVRRNLSPAAYPSPIELVEVELPAGARVAYDHASARGVGVSQQIWLIAGRLALTVGDVTYVLDAGDCLAMRLDAPVAFHNPGTDTARYVVALVLDGATRG